MQSLRIDLTPTQRLVAILWGAGCEEAATAIFVSELRQAGVTVKLIGIGGRRSSGQYGVKLVPDLPINRAVRLAPRVACLVIPCCVETIRRFACDPFFVEFLQVVQQQRALIVVSEIVESEPIASLCRGAICYPAGEEIFEFVQQVADGLAGV